MTPNELRDIIQKVYCKVDYDFIKELYESDFESYTQEKWKSFQANWTTWYCNLDATHQTKFLNMLYK